ncbi:MAG: hypothetical protein RSD14_03495, partial [Clostridia bacterium]
MDGVIIPVILMVVLCVFGITFMVVTSRQSKKNSINKDGKGKNGENGENVNNSKSDKKTKKEDIPKEDMFKFMEFDRILDNMIVQNNGSKFTMAVKCKGINYDLMSEVERLSIEEGFITFLNTLRFPIQLYVQAQNIDLKKNV